MRDYKAEYARRIENALKRGFTRQQARGHPGKQQAHIKPERATKHKTEADKRILEKAIKRTGETTGKRTEKTIGHIVYPDAIIHNHPYIVKVPVNKRQYEKYQRLNRKYGPETADRYILAEVYKAPVLAGGQYVDDVDYDSFEYDDSGDDDSYAISTGSNYFAGF